MESKINPSSIDAIIRSARRIEKEITKAIESNQTDTVDMLSKEFDSTLSEILCFPVSSLQTFKAKLRFGINMIMPGHEDADFVSYVFENLQHDIDSLESTLIEN